MPSPTRRAYRYLLGDSTREAARLRAQARLWDPTAHALFDRLHVRRDAAVLEIGPGSGSLHAELRRRVQGPVDAVEPSTVFVRTPSRLAVRDGFGQGRVWHATLAEANLPKAHYDLIFARWVFLFLPDPARHVRKLARALKPGGVLAIEDYQRETMRMIPTPDVWDRFLAADRAFFATQGGHASIAGQLPAMFARAGLETIDVTPTIRSGHPGSPVWSWISTYFLDILDRLVGLGGFTASDARRLRRHWDAAALNPSSLLIGPAVIDVVGKKARVTRTRDD